jgi:hydrogenase nickel incorporation protein HypA/HybF
MHELAISSAIVHTALDHAEGRRVRAVRVEVGALRQVVPASLEFYFGVAARETLCDGARLELELIAALMRCRACGVEWDPAPAPGCEGHSAPPLPRFRCPACNAAGAEVLAGEELLVGSIDVEERSAGRSLAAAEAGALQPEARS